MITTPSTLGPVSAYIPCYNNAETVALAIAGMRNQTHPVDELFVVDDGSSDSSVSVAENLGVTVIRMEKNQGRGAVRAKAMEMARHEFVLCGDATNRLSPNFLEKALKWFSDEKVVGAYGRWLDRNAHGPVDRWRARHLFQQNEIHAPNPRSQLATYAAILRKSATLRAGNYDASLRHGEDYDLGGRLLSLGDVVYDPLLEVAPVVHNSLLQVMERYSRWNRASVKVYTVTDFLESHVVAWKILIPKDLYYRDWTATLISATMPYFCLAFADKRAFRIQARDRPAETERVENKPEA